MTSIAQNLEELWEKWRDGAVQPRPVYHLIQSEADMFFKEVADLKAELEKLRKAIRNVPLDDIGHGSRVIRCFFCEAEVFHDMYAVLKQPKIAHTDTCIFADCVSKTAKSEPPKPKSNAKETV